MDADGEFVEGWLVAQVLGEGAYGEVRLLVHAQSGSCVALKSVRAECADAAAAAAREAALHRALRHPHVLRCLGARTYQSMHYMFLEYAQGGELFDRIEPDVGMSVRGARRYWRQLLNGLEYLHGRGVAHRDIKPENLLLDSEDRLKISDFGMATVFRHAGRERLLSRVCGTVPYAAPEVLEAAARPYRAAPADLWAAAVVLYAMLVGELPWERAHVADRRYAVWCAQLAAAAAGEDAEAGGGGTGGAWRRVAGEARALLALALHPAPDARPSIETLLKHDWLKPEAEPPKTVAALTSRPWSSQPAPPASAELDASAATAIAPDELEVLACYSQPVIADDLLLSTQSERALTQSSQQGGVLARLVRRMTRIWVRVDEDTALHELCIVLRHKTYTWRHLHPRILAVECGPTVRMRVWAVRANNAPVMLEFRRSRGCGLEFKRRYLELRAALRSLAVPPPPHADLLAAPPLYRAAAEPMDQS